jgi:hypothetical protein
MNIATLSTTGSHEIACKPLRRQRSETVGHQMLDEHGKPTAPVISYIGRPSGEGERVRPRHNPAENALIANMRDDPNIPSLQVSLPGLS